MSRVLYLPAVFGLSVGDECNEDYELPSGLICDFNLVCSECPDTGERFCVDPRTGKNG